MDQVSFLQQELQSSNNPNVESKTNENLKLELDTLRTENGGLHVRISEMEKEHTKKVSHQNEIIKRLTNENKELKQITEKKIQETAKELCKSLEDQIRMMSRRIKVAEQLHIENKEVYMQTRDKYSKEKTDIRIIGDMINDLNRVAIKFEEFSVDIMNRVSTISCWAVFAKEWVRSKGMEEKEMVKKSEEEMMGLREKLKEMEKGSEEEMMGLREKLKEMEKVVKVKEEEMMGLMEKMKEMEMVVKEKEEDIVVIGEEKREAIRQLCVWIDYHRSNSRADYLKEIISRK